MTRTFLRRPGISPRRRFYFLDRLPAILAAIALAAAGPAAAGNPAPPSERMLVTDVVDGDTIKVLSGRRQETVRLIGVDTPETGRPGTPVRFYGPEASLFTRRALIEKRVLLKFEPPGRAGGSRDKYQRTLAYVFTDDGSNFNLALIEQGFGRAYTRYPFQYAQAFRKAEQAARAARRGIWNEAKRNEWSDPARRGKVIGNIRTNIYHVPGQRYYDAIGEKNRIYFPSEAAARKAGFRRARN
jgi:micrococcal nuclease